MKSIKLHPEYGLNPSIEMCSICGKETGGILLLGASCKGEAPRKSMSGDICDECREIIEKQNGVFLLEVKEGSRDNPERTGRYMAVKKELTERIFNNSGPVLYVEETVYSDLLKRMEE